VTATNASNASGGNTTYTITGSDAPSNAVICGSPSGAAVLISGFTTAANNSTDAGFICASSTASTLVLVNGSGSLEGPISPKDNNANPIITNTTASIGFQAFGIPAGFPVAVVNCTDTRFNVPNYSKSGFATPSGIGPVTPSGSAAWNGTWSIANVTITYPWTSAPGGASETSGTCILTNVQGNPGNFLMTHFTYISDTDTPIGTGASVHGGPNFAMDSLFRDSIVLTRFSAGAGSGGWFNSAVGGSSEGTASGGTTGTMQFDRDITSLTADHIVWPRPTGTNTHYTEYGNHPSYKDSAGCTGAGCNPPTTMFFPTSDFCSGSTPTSNCVGFVGAMNASSMPIVLDDYHGYALRSDSSFHNAASDGTDMGAIMSAIDSAQTANLYVCTSSCGSPGPYPDQ
jgi:hypothetical protein